MRLPAHLTLTNTTPLLATMASVCWYERTLQPADPQHFCHLSIVKLDERILRHFKLGVFVGVKKATEDDLHTAFFINEQEAGPSDVALLVGGLKAVPIELQKAFQEIVRSTAKPKKRRRK